MPNQLHDTVIEFLEHYRKEHPQFYYWLREKNTKNRLEDGFWFQGTERYAFVGLYNRGGGSNMTRSFGLVFREGAGDNIDCRVEIVHNEEKEQTVLAFYEKAVQLLGSFEKLHETKFEKILSKTDGLTAAKNFLINEKPRIDSLINSLHLEYLFITKEAFLKKFERVNSYRRSSAIQPLQNIKKVALQESHPLNQILYGPPGTGKTYRMQHLIKQLNIVESVEASVPDFEAFVEGFHWWELVALVLFEMKQASVPEILDHDIIQAKFRISSILHQPQRIWNTLQNRTVLDCPNVKGDVDRRNGELIFYKNSDSVWRLNNENDFKSQFPYLVEDYTKLQNTHSGVKVRKHYTFTTCHQSLTYEDFVEGIKPILKATSDDEEEKQLEYDIRKGYFYQACEKAVVRAGYSSLAEALNDNQENRKIRFKEAKSQNKIYVLFLDEINRCNISAVFGELITLLEDDKRLGAENEIADTLLPYSQTYFGIPANLHIIGTMNTADRSVEALDTALRRRFVFEEMMPKPELLSPLMDSSDAVNLQTMLSAINERLAAMLTKDHTIGHAWLMDVRSLNDLQLAFKNKILPLLQEYFYNNFEKIGLVLGNAFLEEKPTKGIFAKDFKGADDLKSDYEEKTMYSLKDPFDLTREDFQNIYA